MPTYRSFLATGSYANASNAYDNNSSTYAELNLSESLTAPAPSAIVGTWSCSTSMTGLASVTLNITRSLTLIPAPAGNTVTLSYSWDGQTYQWLNDDSTTFASTTSQFSIPVPSQSTSLSQLRVRLTTGVSSYYDADLGKNLYCGSSSKVYEISVDVVQTGSFISFTASKSQINYGEKINLTNNFTGTVNITVTPGTWGTWVSGVAQTSGSITSGTQFTSNYTVVSPASNGTSNLPYSFVPRSLSVSPIQGVPVAGRSIALQLGLYGVDTRYAVPGTLSITDPDGATTTASYVTGAFNTLANTPSAGVDTYLTYFTAQILFMKVGTYQISLAAGGASTSTSFVVASGGAKKSACCGTA